MIHELKTWPEYFIKVRYGQKRFEIRKDDRPFEESDQLLLKEWNPHDEEYTGREMLWDVLYILRDAPTMGLMEGFVILSIAPPR